MTDLVSLFNNIDRIALSLERIASALEDRDASSNNAPSYSHPDLEGGGQGPDTIGSDKPKRTRRTKAQIEADAASEKRQPAGLALESGEFVPAATLNTPVVTTAEAQALGVVPPAFPVGQPPAVASQTPSVPTFVPTILPEVPAASQVIVPLALLPSAVQQNPVPLQQVTAPLAAPTAITLPVAAPVVVTSAEEDFVKLYQTIAPVYNNAREAFAELFANHGLSLPISDPSNNQLPGPGLRALSPEQRAAVQRDCETLSAQVVARGI